MSPRLNRLPALALLLALLVLGGCVVAPYGDGYGRGYGHHGYYSQGYGHGWDGPRRGW